MAGIQIGANFDYKSTLPLDNRDLFDTLEQMVAFEINSIDDGHLSFVKSTGKTYQFISTNTVDETLGRWREFKSGSDSSEQGEESIIEKIKVNSIALPVDTGDKSVDISIPEVEELTEQDVLDLIGLSTEQIQSLQNLIDDGVIQLNKTFSSSEIYTRIQTAIATCKDYTLQEIAKKISGSYVLVSSTSEMISDQYIYLLKNGDIYDIYVIVNGSPEVIGNTNIDLTQYLTISDAETTYLKIEDATPLFDAKIDKTNIATSVDENSTNDEVVGAKLLYDSLENADAKSTADVVLNGTSVGALEDGQTIPTGTSFQEFLEMISTRVIHPTYVNPSLSITTNKSLVEIGQPTTITINTTFTKNDGGDMSARTLYRGSTSINTDVLDITSYSDSITPLADIVYKIDVDYGEGITKQNNLGQDDPFNKIMANTISKSVTVKAVNASYYGVVDTLTPSETDIKALTKTLKQNKSLDWSGINANNQRLCYCYPSSYGVISDVKDANGFSYKNSYTKTTITIDSVNYNLYVMTDNTTVSGFKQIFS